MREHDLQQDFPRRAEFQKRPGHDAEWAPSRRLGFLDAVLEKTAAASSGNRGLIFDL
jgi:hypothetical protein